MTQDNIERLFSFVPVGSLSTLTDIEVDVTLSGLDLVALVQSLKAGYKGLQDYCSTGVLAVLMQDDWEAIEGKRAYWEFGRGHLGGLAARLIDEVDKMDIDGPTIGEWMEGVANGGSK